MPDQLAIYTIGHSAHPFETFLGLLTSHGITAVADVRSTPYSRHAPQYCKDALSRSLTDAGVSYVFLGRELGARSEDPACYDGDQVSYEKLAQTDAFQSGIERLITGAAGYRIALMCAERDPVNCHRTVLVSKALTDRGVDVRHILTSGKLEHHSATMRRIADALGMPHEDLLHSPEDIIAEAYLRRGKQMAYRRNRD